jgi:hypothetical protein
MIMRALILSAVVFIGLGSLCYAQSQPQTLKGVFAPPGSSSGLGVSPKSGGLSGPNIAVGNGPRVTVPGGDPVQGQTLPSDVTPTPLPDRPGYGAVTVNGHRAVVDLSTNRIYQLLD